MSVAGPLLALLLLAASAAPAQPLPDCPATLRVDAQATASVIPPVVCLSPGQDTLWRLDAALLPGEEGLQVSGDEQPLPVVRGGDVFTVPLPDDFPTAARYRLTLRFAGGEVPATLTMELVVHPARATRQVRVYRQARPPQDLAREAQEARAEAEQCGEEKARLQATCSVAVGLRGLLLAQQPPLVAYFAALELTRAVTWAKDSTPSFMTAFAYRAGRSRALAVRLKNLGTVPWSAAGAQLTGPEMEALPLLPPGQVAPIPPGKSGWVVVELAETEVLPPGPFTLTLWDEQGQHAVTVENLAFP